MADGSGLRTPARAKDAPRSRLNAAESKANRDAEPALVVVSGSMAMARAAMTVLAGLTGQR
jgi:hypothetical protein